MVSSSDPSRRCARPRHRRGGEQGAARPEPGRAPRQEHLRHPSDRGVQPVEHQRHRPSAGRSRQRGIRHRRAGVQAPGASPFEAGRAPSQPRRRRRSGACPGPTGRHAQRRQTQSVDQTQRACHPCSGGGHPPSWGQSLPQPWGACTCGPLRHSARRGAGRGRGRPRVGGLANDDPAVAVAGSLARSRPLGAVGGARAPIPGPAHRASLKGGRPTEGRPSSPQTAEGSTEPRQAGPLGGKARPAHRASQRLPPAPRGRSGAPQRQASPAVASARPLPPAGRSGASRPGVGRLPNDGAPVGVPRTLARALPVDHLSPGRVLPSRIPTGPGASGSTVPTLPVVLRPIVSVDDRRVRSSCRQSRIPEENG